MTSKRILWSLLAIIAVMLSAGMAVSEDGAGAVVTGALSAPPHAHLVDSIRGPSLGATTRGDALAKGICRTHDSCARTFFVVPHIDVARKSWVALAARLHAIPG